MLSALILGIVEGLTEFLPVSSTGHMIIVGHMIGFDGNLAKIFDVVIQLGASFLSSSFIADVLPVSSPKKVGSWEKG